MDEHDLKRFVDAQRDVYEQAAAELLLGPRLRECVKEVMSVIDRSIEDIFGYPDHLKFHSSMTLFAHAARENAIYLDALKKYFRSEFDRQTIERL